MLAEMTNASWYLSVCQAGVLLLRLLPGIWDHTLHTQTWTAAYSVPSMQHEGQWRNQDLVLLVVAHLYVYMGGRRLPPWESLEAQGGSSPCDPFG